MRPLAAQRTKQCRPSLENPRTKTLRRGLYLLRKLPITRLNQVWCSDITYTPVDNVFLYLVAIMDWATRKVLAWRLSNTLDAGVCVEALEEAIAKYLSLIHI